MKQSEIFITDCDHESVDMEREICRKAGWDLTVCQCATPQQVIQQCQGARALINQYAPLDKLVFKALPQLEVVVRYGVGVDNIRVEEATACGVQVCNVPDYGMNEVADQAFAMMLSLLRRLPQTDGDAKSGVWDYRRAMPLHRFSHLTVGVLGLGRIGSAFAARLQPFGFRVIGHDIRQLDEDFALPPGVESVSFAQLLHQSDVLSVHCSLNGGTCHLFDESAFRQMKPTAYFINVARGGIVDEKGLKVALEGGFIAGAGLDVLEREPIGKSHFLCHSDRVVLSPHIAWYSEESTRELKEKCARQAVEFLETGTALYPVNQVKERRVP